LYQPLDPYNHVVDNTPILGLITRVDLVNAQVDNNTTILNSAIGTQGTLANRLAQSINDDGSLKTVAIDNALHSIAEHIDSGGFVRMTLAERDKLSFIAPQATSFQCQVSTISGIRTFSNETMVISPSDSITWRAVGETIFADTNFPTTVRHRHYYNIIPVPQNLITPDYKNYYTSSVATPYMTGSLRVYVNGIRLNDSVPTGSLMYSEGLDVDGVVTSGAFSLSQAISASAVIIIDFDVLFM
jgi:hypothetical protein